VETEAQSNELAAAGCWATKGPAIRHIAITGASSGIGASLARHYAGAGIGLSLLGRNESRLMHIADECSAAGARVSCAVGDVADADFMQRWLEESDSRAPLDMVFANAGIGGRMSMPGPAGESIAVAREIFSTNIIGVANSVLPILPRFVARRSGNIVIVSSLAALVALPSAPAYSASKAAVRSYGHGLRRLLAPHGVRVSVVCPGFVDTPMSASISGRLPLLWDSDRAARYIADCLARGRHEIAFPWPLAVMSRLAEILPSSVVDVVLKRLNYGGGVQ